MTFSEWSNNKRKKKEKDTAQTPAYKTPSKSADSTGTSFLEWSDSKKSRESVIGWANASQNLLTEVQDYYKNWKNNDTQYRSFQDRASNLLSCADSWRKQYAGNDETITGINSVVSSLSDLKKYAMSYQQYYAQWDTEEAYETASKRAGYYQKYGDLSANKLRAAAAALPDGEEQDWLKDYAAGVPKTHEELQQDLTWTRGQYQYLSRLQNEGAKLAELKNNLEAGTPGAPGYAELEKQYENMLKQYPSMSIFEDLDGQIAAVEDKIWKLGKDLAVVKLSDVVNEADFDTYKGYVSAKSDGWWDNLRSQYGMGYDDLKYEYINGAENGMREAIAAAAAKKGESGSNSDVYKWRIYRYITPDEISIYNYHYAKDGKEAAEKYLDAINDTLEARYNNVSVQGAKEFASDDPFGASIASVMGTLASVPEYLGDVTDYVSEKLQGNEYASVGYNEFALANSTIRSTVAEQVDWKIGNWDAFDFLYNTTMSGVDSLVAGTMLGNLGGIALGLSAAAQGTNDALKRGMNSGQAFWSGLFSGAFEGLFESVSIGQFNSLKEVAPESVKDIFKNLGKSMLVNASEEMLTEIANIGYDTLVNGEFANYTLEELKNGAWKDALWQVLEAGASGLLIGTGMSMVGSTSSYANQQAQYYKTGKNIQSIDGGVDALLNSADQVRSVSSTQMQKTLTKQIDKVSQKPTARNVGQLNATVQAANTQANASVNQAIAVRNQVSAVTNPTNTTIKPAEVAESLKGKGISTKKADGIAEAIVASLNGQELTRLQRSTLSFALNSSAVRDTISEFINRRKNSTEQSSQNIRENMLSDQTSSDPEKLQQYQIPKRRSNEFSGATNLSEQFKPLEMPVKDVKKTKLAIAKPDSRGIINTRGLAMSLRTPKSHILSNEEIQSVLEDAKELGIDERLLRFNKGYQTGFSDERGYINIKGDILPDPKGITARDRMSQRAVLAHEYYGHYLNHPSEYPVGHWRDEFRASYDAAVKAPNLSDEERRDLMIDAYDRAKEAGEFTGYDETARRIVYGF